MNSKKQIRVAIIGGGISGCSSAYFLKDTFGDNIEITVFEKNDVIGGRLKTHTFKGREYEIGGLNLHSQNLHMQSFLDILNLEKNDVPDESEKLVAFYDSNGIVFSHKGSYYDIFDKFYMVRYFGTQIIGFMSWITTFMDNYKKFYQIQSKSLYTFKSLKDLMSRIDPDLYGKSKQSLKTILQKRGYDDRIMNLANVTTLTSFGQSIELNGFTGLCCLSGIGDKLWSIKNGNKLIPEKLIEKSQAKILTNICVKLICKSVVNANSKNTVIYENKKEEDIHDENFDYVIIALPLYKNSKDNNDLKIDFETGYDFENHEMQDTIIYLIHGELKLFTDLPNDKKIDLHSIDPNIPYKSVRIHLPCDYDRIKDRNLFDKNGPKLYKVDSNIILDSTIFEKIFKKSYEIVVEKRWTAACPNFDINVEESSNIILDEKGRERVYYINEMEWSFSGMEFLCMAAKNISSLIAKKEKITTSKNFLNKK